MLIIDILATIMLLLLCIIMGLLFYLARSEIERSLRYVASVLLTLFMSLTAGYLLMSHIKTDGLLEGFIFHTLLVVFFWAIYLYVYRAAFRMARFYDADKDDYSFKAYLRWRTFFIRREHDFDNHIDGKCKAITVGTTILGVTVCFYVISLFAIYSPSPAISSDYAVEQDAMTMTSINVSKGAKVYSGLPASDTNLVWQTPASIELRNVEVFLVTDRNNTARTYWMIKVNDLSKENKSRVPYFFSSYDIVIIESWMATTQRDYGEFIVP